MEVCALGMGQRSKYAAAMDAQITLWEEEECALGMGQGRNDAAVMDAQTKLNEEDCVEGTGHVAIRKMNIHCIWIRIRGG